MARLSLTYVPAIHIVARLSPDRDAWSLDDLGGVGLQG